jgi:glucose/arabinose dehydrogenase
MPLSRIITLVFSLLPAALFAAEPAINKLKKPPGFQLSLYAQVAGARSLTLGSDGTVYVGTRGDKVYALLPDLEKKGKAGGVRVVAEGLHSPNGVAFKEGDLYIAETSRLSVILSVAKDLVTPTKPQPWGPAFPKDEHHGWKFIAWGPDGWLYVPQGAPCNACERDPELYGTIFRVSPDGKKRELVARGVRNTVGFDWHPKTKQLWFIDNGRDLLGDDRPADELNRVTAKNQHFGFPYCHAGTLLDPEFGSGKDCANYAAPELAIPAHSAALGFRFLRHQANSLWNGSILLAEHGSWNRSSPIGYQVARVAFSAQDGKPYRENFLTGFLAGDKAWGRPVDVLELEDGSILISDDKAGAVYRVSRKL